MKRRMRHGKIKVLSPPAQRLPSAQGPQVLAPASSCPAPNAGTGTPVANRIPGPAFPLPTLAGSSGRPLTYGIPVRR